MVAAGRARATKAELLEDPFAEPLVRAAALNFFTRWAAVELSADDVHIRHPWVMQPRDRLLTCHSSIIDHSSLTRRRPASARVIFASCSRCPRSTELPLPLRDGGFRDRPAASPPSSRPRQLAAGRRADLPICSRANRSARRLPACDGQAASPPTCLPCGSPKACCVLAPGGPDRVLDNITDLHAHGSQLSRRSS